MLYSVYLWYVKGVVPMIREAGCENKIKSNIHLCLQDVSWKYLPIYFLTIHIDWFKMNNLQGINHILLVADKNSVILAIL